MTDDAVAAFLKAACVPRVGSHASGTLEDGDAILAAHPQTATHNVYTAAVLGDEASVHRFLSEEPGRATEKGGPYEWDALTYLCFSRYLRLDRARSRGFVPAAQALLDAGADANTGWYERDHEPEPEWESAIYGAAGVAHHAELTRLLLERGANPNDNETPYHVPETYDNAAMKVLVASGTLTDDSVATMLLRKTDWHDFEAIKWLLEHGANPARVTRWGGATALHHAVLRDNHRATIELLLDHGADPALASNRGTAIAIAARRGRADLLELFERRGIHLELHGVERLIAACARNDEESVHARTARQPDLVREVIAEGGKMLAEFAGNGNVAGIRRLLDIGVDVDAVFKDGDGHWDIAKDSTALHVAAWRAQHQAVKLLIERGASISLMDGKGRTPLALAVRACVDSYWTDRRSPASVEALLEAGAVVSGVKFPSGYAEVDRLLAPHMSS